MSRKIRFWSTLKSNIWKRTVEVAKRTELHMNPNQSASNHITSYVKNHLVSLGVLLAAYGAFYLWVVISTGWSPTDWGKDVVQCVPSGVSSLIPRSYVSPIFFVTSLPALIIGSGMLCVYSLRALRFGLTGDSERVAVLLVMFGFAYQVLGAWPLQTASNFPWEWQKQIMSYGLLFTWLLYALSLMALIVGSVTLYVHSREYHRKHPEFSLVELTE
jgi:hypothetical protein